MKNNIEDILLTITDHCNLKCIYCSVSPDYEYSTKNAEMSITDLDVIFKKLSLLPNLKSIILSGGEISMFKHLKYLFQKANSLSKSLYIITNGVNLSASFIDIVKFYKPTVMITLDSTIDEISMITRGKGTNKKVLDSILLFKSLKLEIVVISVVNHFNIDTLPNDIIYLHSLGICNFLLQQLHCVGKANKDLFITLTPNTKQIEILYQELLKIERKYIKVNIDYNEICFFNKRDEIFNSKCKNELKYKPYRIFSCGAASKFCAVKVNGDVIPCIALPECILGNLVNDSITKIFNSIEMKNLLDLQNYRVDTILGCEGCKFMPVCDGGCRADVLHLYGDPFKKHPNCHHNHDIIYKSK